MTLGEMKKKVYTLIEEYADNVNMTEDEDLSLKMNFVINQIQNELARFKKISANDTREVQKNDKIELNDIDSDIYQLDIIRGIEYEKIGNFIIFKEDGEADIYYFKYPTKIDDTTADTYTFELSSDVLEIMPYGVAADLLKSDVSSQYGAIYAQRYQELKSALDPRYDMGSVYLEGGFEI